MADGTTLVSCLQGSASRWADRPAVVGPSGATLTYAELDARSDRLAAALQAQGLGRGDRVGVAMGKSESAVVALFGIMKAACVVVPADRTWPAPRLGQVFTGCGASLVLVDPTSPPGLAALEGIRRVPVNAQGVLVDGAARLTRPGHASTASAPGGPAPEDLACLLHTSGSTGVPKGVMLTHRNIASFLDWCSVTFHPTPEDRFGSHAPFHFDLSVLDVYLSIKHGASVCLIDEDVGRMPRDLARFIEAHRLTVWYSTPSALTWLLQSGEISSEHGASLRLVLFAGEVFPVKHLRALTRLWPGPTYFNLYGPTETNVCTFHRIPLPVDPDRTEPFPIGRPCGHCRALVLDEHGGEVPPGGDGLLYISGTSVFGGYWNRPAESQAAFIERQGVRWYNTGDVVHKLPDGVLDFVGRRDRLVKRRGYRVELGEIECVLQSHRDIVEAAVTSASDEGAGLRLTATIVLKPGTARSVLALRTYCARFLPAYMVPDVFDFIDELPRTSTGKVDYTRLGHAVRLADTPSARHA